MSSHRLLKGLLPLILAASAPLLRGQPSSLQVATRDVQFEINIKEELLRSGQQLQDELRSLRQKDADDAQILKAFRLRDAQQELLRRLTETNTRQATLAEKLNAAVKQDISAQEHEEYRKCSLALSSVDTALKQLQAQLKKQRAVINDYLNKLPPPPTFTLENDKLKSGLSFTLIRQQQLSFYVSAPLPPAAAALLDPAREVAADAPCAALSATEALKLAAELHQQAGILLTLPNQLQLEALAASSYRPAVAVWSCDQFSHKGSLTHNRRKADTAGKLQLTPAQINAAARFRIPFMLVWDPNHQFGPDAFTRELPFAVHRNLGVILVTPAATGARHRLNALADSYRQSLHTTPTAAPAQPNATPAQP